MALIKCRECGNEVSSEAKQCPKCGAAPKKKMGLIGKLFVGILGLWVFGAIIQSASTSSPTATAPKEKTQQEKRWSQVLATVVTVQKAMRNPESVKWESIRTDDEGNIVCLVYRAQNGFGGMNRESMTIVGGKASQTAGAWNKNCKKKLFDLTDIKDSMEYEAAQKN